jgi:hypothetical protein
MGPLQHFDCHFASQINYLHPRDSRIIGHVMLYICNVCNRLSPFIRYMFICVSELISTWLRRKSCLYQRRQVTYLPATRFPLGTGNQGACTVAQDGHLQSSAVGAGGAAELRGYLPVGHSRVGLHRCRPGTDLSGSDQPLSVTDRST